MLHYITVVEFISGNCYMNWYHGYIDPESGAFVQVNNKWAQIDLATLATIGKIYKRIGQHIGLQSATWYFEYRGK